METAINLNEMKFGAVVSPPDERDYQFAGGAAPLESYRSAYKDKIINQLNSSQCGPCAIIAARAETEYRQNGNTRPFSHTCVYGMDDEYAGEGMYMRTLMKIAKAGIPFETVWESWGTKSQCRELVKRMTDEMREEAHKNRESSYYACQTWEDVCRGVSMGGEGIIMVGVYDNWQNPRNGEIGINSGAYHGGHFLRVKDFEVLDEGILKIRCQNSWGEGWGDGGYCYLYSNIHYFNEARVLIDEVNEVKNMRQIRFNRTERTEKPVFIVIHDTANTDKGADALRHFEYFDGGNRGSSADFFVDDTQALQVNDYTKYYTWHCGDGLGKYGITNSNSIGVEMCVNSDGDYNKAFDNMLALTRELMATLGIDAEHVVRHYDASRKNCPQSMSANGWAKWKEFKRRLTEGDELTMTQYEELKKEIQALKPMVYNYVDDNMPAWAKPTVQKLIDKGVLQGEGDGLGLTYDTLRILVMLDRAGAFDN